MIYIFLADYYRKLNGKSLQNKLEELDNLLKNENINSLNYFKLIKGLAGILFCLVDSILTYKNQKKNILTNSQLLLSQSLAMNVFLEVY